MKLKILTFATFLFITLVSFQTTNAQNDQQKHPKDDLPTGDWSISFHSYQGKDYLNSPLIIYSVTSKDTNITQFSIINISTKSIKSFRVKWIAYENENRDKPLVEGQTKLIAFNKFLESGKNGHVKRRVVGLSDLSDSLFQNGKLDKSLDIDLRIIEVQFTDGSGWTTQQGKSDDIKFEFEQKVTFTSDCPKQKCKTSTSPTRRGGTTYSCESSTNNEGCVLASNFESCTNTSCNPSGGGGPGPELPTNQ